MQPCSCEQAVQVNNWARGIGKETLYAEMGMIWYGNEGGPYVEPQTVGSSDGTHYRQSPWNVLWMVHASMELEKMCILQNSSDN